MATRVTPADRHMSVCPHAGIDRSIAISKPTVGFERFLSSIVSTAPSDRTRIHGADDMPAPC